MPALLIWRGVKSLKSLRKNYYKHLKAEDGIIIVSFLRVFD